MAKYLVVHPWIGVKKGQIIDMESVHPAWAPNLQLLDSGEPELTPATPKATSASERKIAAVAKLKELGIDHDGRKSAEELEKLIPEEVVELEKATEEGEK